ncbi:TetR/AcrR family transcriptional regulator [Mycolicibacterium insubricum]|uniref:TetR/AcrR family transcriptional regulator n=1 Tax=Mycolicibacterium insubricum TaxID=444597 RepID=UPI0021F3C747|nr:TetR/AcrR family transcriptional regulator [Mycolicibacterium insubricum]
MLGKLRYALYGGGRERPIHCRSRAIPGAQQIDLPEYSERVSATTTGNGKPVSTRVRLLESATDLFSRQGFGATGIKAVLAAAEAPYGSLYHFFPGGKQELGAAALAYGGERYRVILASVYPENSDVVQDTADSFARQLRCWRKPTSATPARSRPSPWKLPTTTR